MKHSAKAIPLYRRDLLRDVPVRKVLPTHVGTGVRRRTSVGRGTVPVHLLYERERGRAVVVRPERPPQDLLRYAIEAGFCYFCGKRGFQVLASHTARMHDVGRFLLRDWAGMMMNEPVNPEYSQKSRERALRLGAGERLKGSPPGKRKRITEAGKDSMRRRLAAVRSPEQQRRASLGNARRSFIVRSCHECGEPITTLPHLRTGRRWAKVTCSEPCRKLIRQRTQLVSARTRKERNQR